MGEERLVLFNLPAQGNGVVRIGDERRVDLRELERQSVVDQ